MWVTELGMWVTGYELSMCDGACPLTSKSRFQTWHFLKRGIGRKSKDPAKICIFEEILEAIFQLSVEHLIFHLEFMSAVAALLFFKPGSSYYSGFGMSPGQKACTFQLPPYKN